MSDEPTHTPGRDILVVDDNQANLVAIEAALESLGRPLVFARSGVEALARLLEQDFALILMDVSMPELDGFETAKLIRARDRNRSTPIIFVTGVAMQDTSMLRGYDLGAFDYLVKPIRPEILRAKAQVFVELQERTAQVRAQELEAQKQRLEADALAKQMDQLVEMDRKKDEFIAILAHELRNPLQPLLTAVEMIEAAPETPVPERTREILRRHLQHVRRLVDDLLDVARFASRKLQLHRAHVSIDDMIEQALTQCRATLDERGHCVEVVGAGPGAVVDGDPIRLVQVLGNLINNAARYTPPGGHIAIHAVHEAGEIVVRVADDGRGISAHVLPHIFEMFMQERSTTDGVGGLGLGLGLVKRIVDLHGGTVSGHSEGEGKGSTFEVRLPAAATGTATSRTHEPERLAVKPLRAVICEDAPDVREVLAAMLRSHGHQVTTVEDGRAGLHVILEQNPDVALIDIGLPGISGYDLARALRRELGSARPRLVAMTGYGQLADRAAAFEAGFDAHVTKPATSDEILRALTSEES